MAAALDEALAALSESMPRVAALRNELAEHVVNSTDRVQVTGDPEHRLPSIASFTCGNVDGELLVVLLDHAGVAAATGSACSTGSTDPSHVLSAMGINAAQAAGALRISLADDITQEELDLLKERIPAAIQRARLMSGLV